MKARRKELAADQKAAADAAICEKLKARSDIGLMAFDFGSPLAVYLASPDEINIDPFIEYMLHMGVEVVAPRWNGETYELAKIKGLDEKNLRLGPMGIREPAEWYDRFLASAPKGAVKIGVAYSFQIVDDLPSEPHDIPLTEVVDGSPEAKTRPRSRADFVV